MGSPNGAQVHGELIMSGRLDFVQAPPLFDYLEAERETVTFVVGKGESRRYFYFIQGGIVWISSGEPGELLGDALVRTGILPEEIVRRSLADSRREGQQFSSYLIRKSLVTEEQLASSAEDMGKQIVFQAFQELRGDFWVYRGVPPQVKSGMLRLSPRVLMLDFFGNRNLPEVTFDDAALNFLKGLLLSRDQVFKPEFQVLPETAIRLIQLLRSPDASSNEVCQHIMTSPELSARILRVANSPLLCLAVRVDSLPQAIALLGFRKISQLVLGLSLDSMRGGKHFRDIRTRIHSESIRMAFLAKDLAFILGQDVEELFLVGLLYNIGIIMSLDILEKRLAKADFARVEQNQGLDRWLRQIAPGVFHVWKDELAFPSEVVDVLSHSLREGDAAFGADRRTVILRAAAALVGELTVDRREHFLRDLESHPVMETLGFRPADYGTFRRMTLSSMGMYEALIGQ